MKMISTTIKKKYLLEILEGSKKIEYKLPTEFWKKRLDPLIKDRESKIINFLCGKDSYKFEVNYIQFISVPWTIDIDGNLTHQYYAIYLGNEIK